MSRKETSIRTVSSLRFFTECVNRLHPFILTGLGITRAIQALASEYESKEEQPGLEIQRFTVVGIKKGAPISKGSFKRAQPIVRKTRGRESFL